MLVGDDSQVALQLDNVSVRYREDLPMVLNGLSFKIQKGEKIGVVGSSGAGKSSLFNLFLGILPPSEGTMLVNNKDTTDLDLSSIRSQFTYISQESFLFEGSLAQNLDPQEKKSMAELKGAMESLGCEQVMERGLDSQIEQSVSAGERQLVCLLRGLLDRRHILLVDEATASLDA